jgi:hypothetical protein
MAYPISRININKNTRQLKLKIKPNENLELYKIYIQESIEINKKKQSLTEFNSI